MFYSPNPDYTYFSEDLMIRCFKPAKIPEIRVFFKIISGHKFFIENCCTLFRAYCMPMYACQLWNKYTQASMKHLRAAYNSAYPIMHYIPRNVSVHQYQVSHCVRTFDAVLRNNMYRVFIRCTSSSNFFIRSLQMSDAFYKSSFFLNYSTLLYGDQMQ